MVHFRIRDIRSGWSNLWFVKIEAGEIYIFVSLWVCGRREASVLNGTLGGYFSDGGYPIGVVLRAIPLGDLNEKIVEVQANGGIVGQPMPDNWDGNWPSLAPEHEAAPAFVE
jgi:hypothetical protein